ncbi:wall-associated receptor kinase-like 8 [Miscanthus floridulus]|uniref:wall-associated receptor kinase-like 8 n=1 Tax=Miscanthus floridulus TaxID=154761 RepID=UPI003458C051
MACAALFSPVIVWSPVETSSSTAVLAASRSINIKAEGNKTVDGCPASCGNLTFAYPFGIGPNCSRGPDFRLICVDESRPPKLFLRDGVSEVLNSIDVGFDGSGYNYIWASMWRAISMKSGVRVYNMSFEPAGRSFSYTFNDVLNVTGCDLDVYWIDQITGMTMLGCSTWCPGAGGEEITETAARYNCSGMGCC